MARRDAGFAVPLALMVWSNSVAAQDTAHLGRWACQFTYFELDPGGNQTGGFLREFGIAFYANGAFEAYGTETDAQTTFEFQSEGIWEKQGNVIAASGPELGSVPGLTFSFSGTLQPDGSMRSLREQIEPSQGHVSDRSLWACQRRN